MILCEKPLALNGARGRGDGRGGREGRACRTSSGTTTAACRRSRWPRSSSTRAGSAGSSTTARIFLQDWTISADLPQGGAALWRLDVAAAGSGVTGDLLAHCIDTALWLNGDIAERHAPMTETFIKERVHTADRRGAAGRHRRRLRLPGPLRERLAGHLRVHPLRPRPQGALHLRDQRRDRPRSAGTCTTCTGWSTSTTATTANVRGWRTIHVDATATTLHGPLVGARPADRLRALLRPRASPTSSRG